VNRFVLSSIIVGVLVAAAEVAGGQTTSINAEYLGTLKVFLESPQFAGSRTILNVRSCTLEGPKIKAACISPSADWTNSMPGGPRRLDIRATLKTEEGELIFLEGEGVNYGGYDVAALRYMTNSTSYGWLNGLLTVAKRVPSAEVPVAFDIFVVR